MTNEALRAEDQQHIEAFHQSVNMTAKQLAEWLKTPESKAVGQKSSENAESTGHESGRNIVRLLEKPRSEYSEADIHEMQRVVSYVHRHMAQRPAGDVSETRWRYSPMNWGHDPLKQK